MRRDSSRVVNLLSRATNLTEDMKPQVASSSSSSNTIQRPPVAAMFLWPLISGLLFSNAQYHSSITASLVATNSLACDSNRLIRCQTDAVREMQLLTGSLVQPGAGQPYGTLSGPPYSPAVKQRELLREREHQQHHNSVSSICRLVRSNLDCLLNSAPACYELGLQTAQVSEVILRAKKFLEQNRCNEPDDSWQTTFCYRSLEVRNCEDRHGFTVFTGGQLVANTSSCFAYQAFRNCISSHIKTSCKIHEIDMLNEYLIDRAADLAWRCPNNATSLSILGGLQQQQQQHSSYANYEQRPIQPSYAGGGSGTSGVTFLADRIRDQQAWEKFKNPYEDSRYGISRYPNGGVLSSGGSGDVFDRLVVGAPNAGFDTDSDCPVRAAPFARDCEDTLIEQQRLARDARDGNELQRRICCSLYQYRDCISRVVLDRCADASPATVEVLMGVRRREMMLTCRTFNRELCSGALGLGNSLNCFVLVLSLAFASIHLLYYTNDNKHPRH